MKIGHAFIHVEAVNRRAHSMKEGSVEIVNRALFDVGVLAGLKASDPVATF